MLGLILSSVGELLKYLEYLFKLMENYFDALEI